MDQMTQATKAFAKNAAKALFVDLDIRAVERYWSRQRYVQHSPFVDDGYDGFYKFAKKLVASGAAGIHHRFIAQGDLVVIHSEVPGFAVVLDFFRVENGKFVEHWDGVDVHKQPAVPKTPSGHTMVDGETAISDYHLTDANAERVDDYLHTVFVDNNKNAIPRFFAADGQLIQHHKEIEDGVSGLKKYLDDAAASGNTIDYLKVHKLIAEGNFVVAMSEVMIGGKLHNWVDMFRLADGVIAEQWSVVMPLPPACVHDNGAF